MINERDISIIEEYLQGSLSAEEDAKVVERLQKDRELNDAYEQEKALAETLSPKDVDFLKSLKQVVDNNNPVQKGINKILIVLILLALTVLTLVFYNYWKDQQLKQINTPEVLYASNFEPYPMVYTLRNEDYQPLRSFINAYNSKDYSKALQELSSIEDVSIPSDLRVLYNGIMLIELNQDIEAIELLDDWSNSESENYETILWYKALAYLKIGDIESCKSNLKLLTLKSSTSSTLRKKATNLLQSIDS